MILMWTPLSSCHAFHPQTFFLCLLPASVSMEHSTQPGSEGTAPPARHHLSLLLALQWAPETPLPTTRWLCIKCPRGLDDISCLHLGTVQCSNLCSSDTCRVYIFPSRSSDHWRSQETPCHLGIGVLLGSHQLPAPAHFSFGSFVILQVIGGGFLYILSIPREFQMLRIPSVSPLPIC